MDFIPGENLEECLKKWTKNGEADGPRMCDLVYEQLAEMMWQLYRHKFDRIGSITKTPEGQWVITKRPMTLDMQRQAFGVPGFPVETWPTGPLLRSQDYKAMVVDQLQYQLEHLRNLNIPVELDRKTGHYVQWENTDMARAMDVARGRFIARRAFATSAATSFHDDGDDGPFVIFNSDFCPRNMLVNPETAEITALVDFEFTNTMPASFAHDPPPWLLPIVLDKTLDLDLFPWWQQEYQDAVDRFLAAMERVEARQQEQQQADHDPPLSALMRASWNSKQCLVNFAFHHSDTVDAIYWAIPEKFREPNWESLLEVEVEAYQAFTKVQIDAYKKGGVAKEGRKSSRSLTNDMGTIIADP